MQPNYNKANWIQWVTAVLVILALVFAYTANTNVKDIEVTPKISCPEIDVSDMTITCPEITIPEMKDLDNQKIKELHQKVYEKEIVSIEKDALEAVEEEVNDEDIKDFLIEMGYDIDEIRDFEIDEDETNIEIVNLGLDDEDDREAIVSLEIKVKYTEEVGYAARQKIILIGTGRFYIDEDPKAELIYSIPA